ncbi:MAG: hypothetical protein K5663_00755 [Clostridiales bacterium]|nr:hypothetical protein [Clostridiales bacterium]
MNKSCHCFVSALLIIAFYTLCIAGAESLLPDMQMLADVKQAVTLLHQNNYQKAAKLLRTGNIDEIKRQCEENCPELFKAVPQTEISVCYSKSSGIYIAVPISFPSSNDCKAIVFKLSENFSVLSARILPWQKVTEDYSGSENVIWNREYVPEYNSLLD